MARIAGIEMPQNKRVVVALTYVYGVGSSTAKQILARANINETIRTNQLSEDQVTRINDIIDKNLTVEGPLRRTVAQNVQRLKDIRCYRGIRHMKGLPVRGQKTRSNARTRKGPRKTVAGKKIAKRMG